MRVPISWLREFAPVPDTETGRDIASRLIQAGLEVETVDTIGEGTEGPLVVGRVLAVEELTGFKKPIRFCRVEVGPGNGHPDTPGVRDIICGATNFGEGELVVVALPGTTLPGGFEITSRQTYGRVSDGMICSERELAVGDGHDGILTLPPGSGAPGDDVRHLLGIDDEVLDIAVTPDRGYALSIRGVAREAAIAYGVPFTDPGVELVDLPAPAQDAEPHPCASEDLAACDLFTLRTITRFNPHAAVPLWMRRRIHACGMRSVSLAVDVTNYVMLETGQPLHAFDQKLLRGAVRARRALPGEQLETLDHEQRTLTAEDLVIADDRGAVGLAGLMGGVQTEISDDSTEIALEAAHFAADVIGRMGRRHKLGSEASRRFERGVDRDLAPYASARACALLLSLGGGQYVGMTAVEGAHTPVVIEIADDLPAEVGGLPVAPSTTSSNLAAVGCSVSEAVNGRLLVGPPTWRPDLTDPYDLVEEVLRLVGYDRIPSVLPTVPPQHGWTDERRLRRRIGVALAGAGYVEAPASPFIGESELAALQLPADDPRRAVVRLANPLSAEQPFLRTTLLPGLVASALRNLSRGRDAVALFEGGTVFLAMPREDVGAVPRPDVARRPERHELDALDQLLPDQPRHFAVLLTGDREPAGWWGGARPTLWADAIAAAQTVGRACGVRVEATAEQDPVFHPGRCAALSLPTSTGATPIGVAGELHPRVIEAFGLPARAAAMEITVDPIVLAAPDVIEAPRISSMPVAKEDVALVVDMSVTAADLARALVAGGGELLESVRLFDEYTGDQAGPGRKSLAFALRFRAPDRTLTAEEVGRARQAAVTAAEQAHGAVLRA